MSKYGSTLSTALCPDSQQFPSYVDLVHRGLLTYYIPSAYRREVRMVWAKYIVYFTINIYHPKQIKLMVLSKQVGRFLLLNSALTFNQSIIFQNNILFFYCYHLQCMHIAHGISKHRKFSEPSRNSGIFPRSEFPSSESKLGKIPENSSEYRKFGIPGSQIFFPGGHNSRGKMETH